MQHLTAKKGTDREIRLSVFEFIDPPINEQDLPLSAVTEITWVMAASPDDTGTALITKTYTGGDITFIDDGDDGQISFLLDDVTDCDRTGRSFWELRILLGGKNYKSEEWGTIAFLDGMAAVAS